MKTLTRLLTVAIVTLTTSLAIAGAGEKRVTETVLPHHTDIYQIKFEAGEPAILRIKGDGSTDLDFYVYNSKGELVAKDDDSTDLALLRWTPGWTGYFKLEVINHGAEENRYMMSTN